MCATHALQLEGAYDVGGQLLRVGQGHAHHAVGLRAAGGPVLKRKFVSCSHGQEVGQLASDWLLTLV